MVGNQVARGERKGDSPQCSRWTISSCLALPPRDTALFSGLALGVWESMDTCPPSCGDLLELKGTPQALVRDGRAQSSRPCCLRDLSTLGVSTHTLLKGRGDGECLSGSRGQAAATASSSTPPAPPGAGALQSSRHTLRWEAAIELGCTSSSCGSRPEPGATAGFSTSPQLPGCVQCSTAFATFATAVVPPSKVP